MGFSMKETLALEAALGRLDYDGFIETVERSRSVPRAHKITIVRAMNHLRFDTGEGNGAELVAHLERLIADPPPPTRARSNGQAAEPAPSGPESGPTARGRRAAAKG